MKVLFLSLLWHFYPAQQKTTPTITPAFLDQNLGKEITTVEPPWMADTYSECCEPCLFCHTQTFWFKKIIQYIFFIIIIKNIYWIIFFTIRLPFIGYSKHELGITNMLYFLKTIFHITPLPPHNSNLSTMATFVYPQGGRCGEVRLY